MTFDKVVNETACETDLHTAIKVEGLTCIGQHPKALKKIKNNEYTINKLKL